MAEAMPKLVAEEQLARIDAMSIAASSSLEHSYVQAERKRLHGLANGACRTRAKQPSQNQLGAMGIGAVMVPAPEPVQQEAV